MDFLEKKQFLQKEEVSLFDAISIWYQSNNPLDYKNHPRVINYNPYNPPKPNILKSKFSIDYHELREKILRSNINLILPKDEGATDDNTFIKISDFKAILIAENYPLGIFKDHTALPTSPQKSISKLMDVAKQVEQAYFNNALPSASTPKGQIMKWLENNQLALGLTNPDIKAIAPVVNPQKTAGCPPTSTSKKSSNNNKPLKYKRK